MSHPGANVDCMPMFTPSKHEALVMITLLEVETFPAEIANRAGLAREETEVILDALRGHGIAWIVNRRSCG
jgi:hypothetical protein